MSIEQEAVDRAVSIAARIQKIDAAVAELKIAIGNNSRGSEVKPMVEMVETPLFRLLSRLREDLRKQLFDLRNL